MESEARVNGILRGGKYYEESNTFIFHAGTMKIETKEFYDLRVFK